MELKLLVFGLAFHTRASWRKPSSINELHDMGYPDSGYKFQSTLVRVKEISSIWTQREGIRPKAAQSFSSSIGYVEPFHNAQPNP